MFAKKEKKQEIADDLKGKEQLSIVEKSIIKIQKLESELEKSKDEKEIKAKEYKEKLEKLAGKLESLQKEKELKIQSLEYEIKRLKEIKVNVDAVTYEEKIHEMEKELLSVSEENEDLKKQEQELLIENQSLLEEVASVKFATESEKVIEIKAQVADAILAVKEEMALEKQKVAKKLAEAETLKKDTQEKLITILRQIRCYGEKIEDYHSDLCSLLEVTEE